MKINFLHDSIIKTRPVQSGALADAEKMRVVKGDSIPVDAVANQLENGHLRVTLGRVGLQRMTVGGKNTVYLYAPHTDYKLEPTRISQDGIDLIKEFEGLELQSYPDPGTGSHPFTIGYGSTGPHVYPGLTITKEQAEEYLKSDLRRFEQGVLHLVRPILNQHELDALVAFAYNCGLGGLEGSTLLRRLNAGDRKSAANEFLRWDKAGDRTLPGLTRRRRAERALFLGEDWRSAGGVA